MSGLLGKFKIGLSSMLVLSLFFSSAARAVTTPNDPRYPEAWYLERINAPAAWEKTVGSRQVVVAILNSGIQVSHPDLAENIWRNPAEQLDGLDNDGNGLADDLYGWDFLGNTPNPGPNFDEEKKFAGFIHGTLVAGLIGAVGNNGTDSAGLNWRVSLMPLRVLNSRGEGRVAEVVKAIDYAISKKADIINLSFTGLDYSEALNQVIGRANASGITVVAAAGNDDKPEGGEGAGTAPHYPACFGGPKEEPWAVIGVAAVDRDNRKTPFSNYGSKCIDLVAPGVGIPGLLVYAPLRPGFENTYGGSWSGTSLSAALVSGSAALLKSIKPDLSPKEVYELLTSAAFNIFASEQNQSFVGQLGAGLLDVGAAVEALLAKYPALRPPREAPPGGRIVITSPKSSLVQIYDLEGRLQKKFYAYQDQKIGVQAAVSQLGFEPPRLVVAPLAGRAPLRIFSLAGELLSQDFFPFGEDWPHGINLASADFDNDGEDEVVAAPRRIGNEVRIYKIDGSLVKKFQPFGARFSGGVNLATGKFDESGEPLVAVTPAGLGGPQVRFFNGAGQLAHPGFFVYEHNWRGGVRLAGLDFDDDGIEEIVTSPAGQRRADINIYSLTGIAQETFLANKAPTPSFALAAGRSGARNLIITASAAKKPTIKIWQADGTLLKSFTLIKGNFSRGLNLLYLP